MVSGYGVSRKFVHLSNLLRLYDLMVSLELCVGMCRL